MEELYNIRKTLRKERAQNGVGSGLTEGKVQGAQALVQRTCGLCATNSAKYICPHCNIPYCSQACFMSSAHGKCADQFAQRMLDEARSQATHEHKLKNNANAGASISVGPNRVEEDAEREARAAGEDQERARMMSILKRLEQFDLDKLGSAPDKDSESDVEITEQDLDSFTPDQLMSLLDPNEVEEFKAMLNDQQDLIDDLPESAAVPTPPQALTTAQTNETPDNKSRERSSDANSDPLLDESTPWWATPGDEATPTLKSSLRLPAPSLDDGEFAKSLNQLAQTMVKRAREASLAQAKGEEATPPQSIVDLRFNVFTVTLVYVYLVRSVGAPNLSSLGLQDSSRYALFEVVSRLLPFLTPSVPKSTIKKTTQPAQLSGSTRDAEVILPNVGQACLFFLSRLTAREQGSDPTYLLQELLGDVHIILRRSQVHEVDDPGQKLENDGQLETIMSDLHSTPAEPPTISSDTDVAQARIRSYPLLKTMGYDLYQALNTHPQPPTSDPSSTKTKKNSSRSKVPRPSVGEMMQRKWLFYLASYISADASSPEELPSEAAMDLRKRPRSVMGQLAAQRTSLESESQRNEFEADLRATHRFEQEQKLNDIVLPVSGNKKVDLPRKSIPQRRSGPLVQEVEPDQQKPALIQGVSADSVDGSRSQGKATSPLQFETRPTSQPESHPPSGPASSPSPPRRVSEASPPAPASVPSPPGPSPDLKEKRSSVPPDSSPKVVDNAPAEQSALPSRSRFAALKARRELSARNMKLVRPSSSHDDEARPSQSVGPVPTDQAQ